MAVSPAVLEASSSNGRRSLRSTLSVGRTSKAPLISFKVAGASADTNGPEGERGRSFTCKIRVGQNRIYTPYMTVYLAISLPKIPYMHRIYMVLANPM